MKKLKRVQEVVQELNIIDDTLFQKMAEDIGFCEEMISTILGEEVTVKEVTPQYSIKNLQGRSVVLDALCVLKNEKEYCIEVQKADDDDHQRRVRYNTSCVTANITEPGTKFREIPNLCAIYISKFDLFQGGKTIYHIDRVVRETGKVVDNGLQEIYVNTKINDGTEVAELMHIFTVKDAYDFEKFPKISGRKKQFKESERGQEEVCELVENYVRECAEEAAKKATKTAEKNGVIRLFQNGASYEMARDAFPSFSDEELQRIYIEHKNK